jgi:L-lactate utilization protein LutC
MTTAEIVVFLAEEAIINPRTERPYSASIINADVKHIEDQWKDDMSRNITRHRARVLAEIRETKKAAWMAGKLSIVLRAIDQEVNLLGLNELERVSVEIALANLFKGFPTEIADQLKGILAKKVSDVKKVKGSKPKLIPFRGAGG